MKRKLAMFMAIILMIGCFTGAVAENAAPDMPALDAQPDSIWQKLADEGVISEETLSAIQQYLQENRPDMPEGNGQSGSGAPEMPDNNGQSDSGAPEMPDNSGQSGAAPEKPDGSQPDGERPNDAPEMPGGNQLGGSGAPEMPNGNGQPNGNQPGGAMISESLLNDLLNAGVITQAEYDAILASDLVTDSMMNPEGAGGNPPFGGASQNVTYSAGTQLSSDTNQTGGEYTSSASDENAILIDSSAAVALTDPTVTKTGDSDGGDRCSFYGVNAAVLAKDGANVTITGGTITTSANGANGVFSYGGNGAQNGATGDGTTVTISDTTITTTGDNAGGIMTTGGGITNASNLTIETSGRSSAAIRTDRGGGTVTVNGGSYTTNGLGSPAIYSTADITVSGAALTSNLSEGVCIEGKNSITLNDCDLTANNTQCNGNATFLDSIMIYQSMSGDADSGTSAFTMNGGSLTSKSGHVFHVTNTQAVITLSGVEIVNEDADDVLLSVCDDGWNGGNNHAELIADQQILSGSVLVGDNSQLTLTLSNGSAFTGSISGEITNSRGDVISTETGDVSVTIDDTSAWTLTADSYVTSFTGSADQIISNGYTLYVNGAALEGTR